MKKALKKEEKEKRSLKTGYGKFFRIEKNVERKKHEQERKTLQTQKTKK